MKKNILCRLLRLSTAPICAFAVLLHSGHAGATECRDAKGGLVLQATPCSDKGEPKAAQPVQQVQQAQQAQPFKPAVAPDTAAPAAAGKNAMLMLMAKELCDINVPGFKRSSEKAYAQWHQANLQTIQGLEQTPGFADGLKKMVQQNQQSRKVTAEERANECASVLTALEDSVRIPNPLLNSAENSWKTWIDALKRADRKLALSCLTMVARDNYKSFLETAPEADLKKMGNSIQGFWITSQLESYQVGVARLGDGTTGEIQFVHKGSEWLISSL